MEQYIEDIAQNDSIGKHDASVEKWKSVSAAVEGCESNQSDGFDCNICLDFVLDPVVTLCGHLYCWPCIYKWIHFQSLSTENPNQQQPQCPVCKTKISEETLVPLYGRGQTRKPTKGKALDLGITIPRRPLSPRCGVHTLLTSTNIPSSGGTQQNHHRSQTQAHYPHTDNYAAVPMHRIGGTTTTSPLIGMFGEMIYSWFFGNADTTLYNYPNSYNLTMNGSPRQRRRLKQADRSLSRICFFLCCCVVLCLLLF